MGRDAGDGAAFGKCLAEPLRVITPVAEHCLGGPQGVDQHGGALVVAGLSLGQCQEDVAAIPVANGMELGGQPGMLLESPQRPVRASGGLPQLQRGKRSAFPDFYLARNGVPVGQASDRHRRVAVHDQPVAVSAGYHAYRVSPLGPACGRLGHQKGSIPYAIWAQAGGHEPRKRQFDRVRIVSEIGGVVFFEGPEAGEEGRH